MSADAPCEWLAESIDEACRKFEFSLWAYVFMPKHVHLLVGPRQPNHEVAEILKAIKRPVGRKAVKFLGQSSPQWLARISVKHGKKVECFFWRAEYRGLGRYSAPGFPGKSDHR